MRSSLLQGRRAAAPVKKSKVVAKADRKHMKALYWGTPSSIPDI